MEGQEDLDLAAVLNQAELPFLMPLTLEHTIPLIQWLGVVVHQQSLMVGMALHFRVHRGLLVLGQVVEAVVVKAEMGALFQGKVAAVLAHLLMPLLMLTRVMFI
ncbi:hypothetical protein [Shewanella sp.]|uniref:hypothetical protein n=1 Tax=Shewanella sp. TaxID=50422 RepID=UPI0026082A43|nr:hypothetical protein [Shewanella sp.]